MNVLILCTGNSCRSQMARAFLQSFDQDLRVQSAGTDPDKSVNSIAVKVMAEAGIDIRCEKPKSVNRYLNEAWDYARSVIMPGRLALTFRERLKNNFTWVSMTLLP